ncbi:hypothetical protein ACS0TY_029171 [Phlomoides rotata]
MESMCDVLDDSSSGEVVKGWGPWLRASDQGGYPSRETDGLSPMDVTNSPMGVVRRKAVMILRTEVMEAVWWVRERLDLLLQAISLLVSMTWIFYWHPRLLTTTQSMRSMRMILGRVWMLTHELRKRKRRNVKQGTVNELTLTLFGSATAVVGATPVNVISTIVVTNNQHF